MGWTPEKDAVIFAGVKEGKTAQQIADEIGGGCTRNMVIGRHDRLRGRKRNKPKKKSRWRR